jgi:predicted PurR-regulated permease PerM
METRVHPKGILSVACWVIALWAMSAARDFLVPLCIAALLAFLMAPLVNLLRRYRFPEGLAVVLGSLLLILPIAGILYALISQSQSLVRDWPHISASIQRGWDQFRESSLAHRFHMERFMGASGTPDGSWVARLRSGAGAGFKVFVEGVRSLVTAGTETVLVLFFAIVMLASRLQLRHSVERLLGQKSSVVGGETLDQVTELIERFLIARLGIVLLVGVVDFGILVGFGMSYAILMGAFLGLMTLVPVVGFFIGVAPPMIAAVGAGHSPLYDVALFLSLGSVSSFQDHILTPKLIGKRLNLNFLMTYLSIFAGERLWGPWGMFLAVPILGVARIVLSAAPQTQAWGELLAEERGPRHRLGKERRSAA